MVAEGGIRCGSVVRDADFWADATTIPGVVERAAHRFTADDALVGEDGAAIEYHRLWFEALMGAAALVERGVQPGDRVALWADNSPEWAIASLAIHCAGGAVVPLSTRWTDAEVDDILERARCAIILADHDLPLHTRAGSPHPVHGVDEPAALAEVKRRIRALRPDDVSHVQFTSGTTGRPKGALLTHRGMVTTTREWVRVVGLRHRDRYPIVNPCSHIGGHKTGLLACWCSGATAYPIARFDPQRLRSLIERDGITFLQGPPAMFQALLDAIDADTMPPPSSVRVAVTGSANIPPALVVRMTETLQLDAVHAGYGLTEATGVVAITRADDPLEVVTRTSGRPIPGVEVRVVDPDGHPLPPGNDGEIQVRGPGVMRGYLDDPRATAEVIDPQGWLATGDVGGLDADGNLAIRDRIKDMVIVGGFNAYPAEIERVLCEHPAVARAAVVGVPDDRLGEVPVAFVVPSAADRDPASTHASIAADASSLADADTLISWVRERLASYKVPRAIWFVDDLPLTAVPKVDKVALAASARDLLGLSDRAADR
jgi:acyl-CoA synthetase (AMP-forming)/AMP-acid ligase II